MIKKVLIVDDNNTNLYMLETLLKGYGFEVTSAENGRDALHKAHLEPPDLIVTDILMPVMDGYALCREWKSDDALKHIPLVFYTATYTESKDEEFALSLGADLFIIKPQEPDIFMNMLKDVMEEKYKARQAVTKPLGEEMEFFRRHNEILFKKLEKKMSDLEIANQKLRISEERYRLSFQNATDVIYTIDNDLNVLNVSPSVERILGYKPQDFIGRSVSDLGYILTPESFKQVIGDMSLVLKGETIEATMYQFIAKDGTIKYGEVSGSPLMREGKIIGIISVARDITDRRQAEEKVRESEEKYRGILENMDDAYYELDLSGNLVFFNEALISKTGYSRGELMGMNYRQYISPETCKLVSRVFSEIYRTGQPVRLFDYEIIMKGGQTRNYESWANLLLDNNNQPIGFRGMARDITERKQAEEAVRRYSAELIEKNEELRAMTQQLWQAAKLATMGELSASIAHELNNPLATVSMRAELLLTKTQQDSPMWRELKIIEQEVERMGNLVASLLQFSRRGQQQISTVNICEEIEKTLELIYYHLRKKDIIIRQEFAKEAPRIHADRQQLRQLFLNLFTNAGDAMPRGGTLTIRVTARPESKEVSIEVADTGTGIPPEILPKVAEPFYTTKPEGKGTGLGLAICRRIVQEHKGTFDLASEGIPGKGTRVYLTLPFLNSNTVDYLFEQ